jgi:hypothetical protein
MIVAEAHDEKPKITTVTCGGTRTRVGATNQGNRIHQWVSKATKPLPFFYPRKDKENYQQEIKELVGVEWIASTLTAPPLICHQSMTIQKGDLTR